MESQIHMLSLHNKTILITGASSGIGAACAELFAHAGARLILCARRADRLDVLTEQLTTRFKTNIISYALDITQYDAVTRTIGSLPPDWQAIDILLNNAGLAVGLDPLAEGSITDWERMIDTNIKGLLYVTKTVLPNMIKRNQGHIINIGSIAGHEVYPKGNVYCATKHAVKALSQGLKMDLLGTHIRVSSIDPGMVNTEFSEVRFHGDKSKAENVYAGITPLAAEDIADAVLYCASKPPHVNISEIVILPTDQASATLIHRRKNDF